MIKDFWCNDCSKYKLMDQESRTKGLCKCCKLSRNSTGTKVINIKPIEILKGIGYRRTKEEAQKTKNDTYDILAARELAANLSSYGEG